MLNLAIDLFREMMILDDVLLSIKNELARAMLSGTYSLGFLIDLTMISPRNLDVTERIVREVMALENPNALRSVTKPCSMFNRALLKGYWHKHYVQPKFMPINLQNEMHRDDTIERVLAPFNGQIITSDILNQLVHALVHDNYVRRLREARLTGEWIASHRESDRVIAERIKLYEGIDQQTGWPHQSVSLTFLPQETRGD